MNRRRLLLRATALAAAPLAPALLRSPAAAATASTASATSAADRLPSRGEILTAARRAADHWLNTHADDPGDNQWARATFFSGLLALHRATGEPRYASYARSWADKHGYGLHNGVTTRHADDHTAGQAYLDLYELDAEPDEAKAAAIEESLHRMTYTDQPDKNDDWWWDDALHMAVPPFARLSVLRGDAGYAEKMHRLYTHAKRAEGGAGLYDRNSGLWYRDARFLPLGVLSPGVRPGLCSRGNGWVTGGR